MSEPMDSPVPQRRPTEESSELLEAEKELAELEDNLAWELSKAVVDTAGIFDPTPASDAVGAAMSIKDGDWIGAGLSILSMVPYAGDVIGKTAKGARAARKINSLRQKVARLIAKIQRLKNRARNAANRARDSVSRSRKAPDTDPGPCVSCQNKVEGRASARRLPATSEASVSEKLERYLLNFDHPKGRSKANFFQKALGFTKENAEDLAKQIKFDPTKAVPTELTSHGQKFYQVIPIQGANGKTIDVPFVWIKNNDDVVRLITATDLTKFR